MFAIYSYCINLYYRKWRGIYCKILLAYFLIFFFSIQKINGSPISGGPIFPQFSVYGKQYQTFAYVYDNTLAIVIFRYIFSYSALIVSRTNTREIFPCSASYCVYCNSMINVCQDITGKWTSKDSQRTVHNFISTCNYMAANELGPSYQAQDRYNLTYPLGYSNYIKSNHMRCKHGEVTNGYPLGDIHRPSISRKWMCELFYPTLVLFYLTLVFDIDM